MDFCRCPLDWHKYLFLPGDAVEPEPLFFCFPGPVFPIETEPRVYPQRWPATIEFQYIVV
jgi:hypothetical protein